MAATKKYKEAPISKNYKVIEEALKDVPFSFTIFFEDEHGNRVKFSKSVTLQEQYR